MNGLPNNFKRFLSSEHLGDTSNYSHMIFRHVMELQDGTQKTIYGLHPALANKKSDTQYSDTCPVIVHPHET